MANKNNGNKSRNQRNKSNRSRNEKNNFQDKAEEREYGKGYRAGKDSREKAGLKYDTMRDNDPSWYVPSNTLLNNVANFPTDNAVGRPLPITFLGTTGTSNKQEIQAGPGILAYNVIPACATKGDPDDPLNLAGSAVYTAMQINSSRNPNYQANDLTLYFLAMSSAYSLLACAIRLYGTLNRFNIMNQYEPKALVKAMGFNYENMVANLANLRARINQYGYELASFYLPSDINYAKRQIFLYQNIYRDSDVSKSQFYMYTPVGFLKWIEGEQASGQAVPTHVKLTVPGTGGSFEDITFDELSDYMDSILAPLRGSEDVRMMASDLIKAYGMNNAFTFTPISDNYTLDPVYNQEVLSQFENAYIMPNCGSVSCDYVQVTGLNTDAVKLNFTAEVASPNWDTGGSAYASNLIQHAMRTPILLNFHKANPTPEDIMVASRLAINPLYDTTTWTASSSTNKVTISRLQASGTEIISGATLWYYDENFQLQADPLCSEEMHFISSVVDSGAKSQAIIETWYNSMNKVSRLSAFDWHPKVGFSSSFSSSSAQLSMTTPWIFDLETWVVVDLDEWLRMNKIALYGLFECRLGDTPRLR